MGPFIIYCKCESHIYLVIKIHGHTVALSSTVKCDGVGCIIYQQVYVRTDIHQHIYLLINDTQAPSSHFPVLIIATWYPLRTYTMSNSHRNPQLLKPFKIVGVFMAIRYDIYLPLGRKIRASKRKLSYPPDIKEMLDTPLFTQYIPRVLSHQNGEIIHFSFSLITQHTVRIINLYKLNNNRYFRLRFI